MVDSRHVTQSTFLSILEANSAERFNNAVDRQEYEQRLITDYGTRIRCCAAILEPVDPADTDTTSNQEVTGKSTSSGNEISDATLREWSVGLGNIDRLIHFRQLYQQGYSVFSDNDYAEHKLTPEQLSEATCRSEVMNLFRQQRDICEQHLSTAMKASDTKAILPLQRLGRLRLAQLRLWERKEINHYLSHATLTPMKKAWITLFKR